MLGWALNLGFAASVGVDEGAIASFTVSVPAWTHTDTVPAWSHTDTVPSWTHTDTEGP